MRRLVSRIRGAGRGTYFLAGALVFAAVAAPLAVAAGEGLPLRGGSTNPGNGQRYAQETKIWSDVNTYGTRQSNLREGRGGGAIYGCRAAAGQESCIRAHNLRQGRAFSFQTSGDEAGYIGVRNPQARPFSTNAQGVATGLNADKVDGRDGSDFALAAQGVKGAFAFNPQGAGSIVNAVNTLNDGAYQLVSTGNGNTAVEIPFPITGRVILVTSGGTAGGATPANCHANYTASSATRITIQQRNHEGEPCSAPFSALIM